MSVKFIKINGISIGIHKPLNCVYIIVSSICLIYITQQYHHHNHQINHQHRLNSPSMFMGSV
jgi:hypothetical protein